MESSSSHRHLSLLIISSGFLLLFTFPWFIALSLLSSFGGFFFIQYFDRVSKFITNYKYKNSPSSTSLPPPQIILLDPLTLSLQQQLKSQQSSSSEECKICSKKDCRRDNCRKSSPEKFTPTPYAPPKLDDLKIPFKLDASIGRFCTSVFDYYISPDWAPYLTRKQLKLSFKQLFLSLGNRIDGRLKDDGKFPVDLSLRKLIPLTLFYSKRILQGGKDEKELIFTEGMREKERLRVRQLSKRVIQGSMSIKEDKECQVWNELCVSVLADGVFWNLFELGTQRIPELVGEYLKKREEVQKNENEATTTTTAEVPPPQNASLSPPPPRRGVDEVDSSLEKVPFLLNSFLDPKDSLEQADPIVSRWKPTLKDITESTDLLYPLIQYLKAVGGQKGLAYLQAVLDDSEDAKEHCRRILEVEYLPGFCRSAYFQDAFGLSRVDQGMEVKIESPGSTRRSKGHFRSSSYGSKSNQAISDLLKMDSSVVEGLPLYSSAPIDPAKYSPLASSYYSTQNHGQHGQEETDSSGFSFFGVGRKKTSVEDVISKFIKSSIHHQSQGQNNSTDGGSEGAGTKRVGIDSRSFEEERDPEVTKRVEIKANAQYDIYDGVVEIMTGSITLNSWLSPLLSSWLSFLRPFLSPFFLSSLESSLDSFLNLDLFVSSVDLITDAFNASFSPVDPATTTTTPYNSSSSRGGGNAKKQKKSSKTLKPSSSSTSVVSAASVSSEEVSVADNEDKCLSPATDQECKSVKEGDKIKDKLLEYLFSSVIDLEKGLKSLKGNRDYLFLFFIDALDILVEELFPDNINTNIN